MLRLLAPALGLTLLGLVFAAGSWAGTGGISPPDSATDSGDAINQVYWVVFALAAVVLVVIEATLLLFIFRYRRRPGTPEGAEGPQVHGNTRVEVIWTLIPALLLLGLAVFTFARVPTVQAEPSAGERGDTVRIKVTAHQFYWQYEHPNGALSFDELYLPVDRTVQLDLGSEDVVHSWWVPELTGKRDAVPGQTNRLYFKANRTGTFENGVCGEFCGIQHARMVFRVHVVSASEYEAWLEENAPEGGDTDLVALGEAEWSAACAKCHGPEGQGDIGPTIAGNGSLTNRDSLRELLYNGQNDDDIPGYMPPVGKGWSDRQIDALMAYIESEPRLSGEAQDGG